MSDLLLRALDNDLKQKLTELARANNRSLSAEAIAVLGEALAPGDEAGLGSELVALFRRTGAGR